VQINFSQGQSFLLLWHLYFMLLFLEMYANNIIKSNIVGLVVVTKTWCLLFWYVFLIDFLMYVLVLEDTSEMKMN